MVLCVCVVVCVLCVCVVVCVVCGVVCVWREDMCVCNGQDISTIHWHESKFPQVVLDPRLTEFCTLALFC